MGLKVCAAKADGFGDLRKHKLEDLACVVGGEVINEEIGSKLEDLTLDMLGQADKVVITKDNTTFIGGKGNKQNIEDRVTMLKLQIEEATNDYDKEKLQERIAKLISGVAVINVGGASEAEINEIKDRVDDALSATKAAIQEGIIVGGGVALLRSSIESDFSNENSEDFNFGIKIVNEAIKEPIYILARNGNKSGDLVIKEISSNSDFNFGYNAKTDKYENLVENGVIDPAKVVRVALENAASVASMILMSKCSIVEDKKIGEQITNSTTLA